MTRKKLENGMTKDNLQIWEVTDSLVEGQLPDLQGFSLAKRATQEFWKF